MSRYCSRCVSDQIRPEAEYQLQGVDVERFGKRGCVINGTVQVTPAKCK